jgi:hypothetical protein
MFEILWNFSPGQLIGLVAVSGGLVVAAIAIIASHWCRVRLGEIEASLKQQMLEKGMSAAEIDQVIKARREKHSHCGHGHGRFGESHANSTNG